MATEYGITHVRYNAAGTHIDPVRVRTITNNSVSLTFQTITRSQVVTALQGEQVYHTLLATSGNPWRKGAKVERVIVNREAYIRTDRNSTARDNLDNLPMF